MLSSWRVPFGRVTYFLLILRVINIVIRFAKITSAVMMEQIVIQSFFVWITKISGMKIAITVMVKIDMKPVTGSSGFGRCFLFVNRYMIPRDRR